MTHRFGRMFERLEARSEGAFVPFVMLGDPDPPTCRAILQTLAASGADAIELGLPFSDPIADGPVVQAAATRALRAGVRQEHCWDLVAGLRRDHPGLPIGLLVYANLVMRRGETRFYADAAAAGADAVLVADLPLEEAGPARQAAAEQGVQTVFIVPPNADDVRLRRLAGATAGFTYVTSRGGVTGSDEELRRDQRDRLARLRQLGAPPALLGFGISRPDQVRTALELGAAGAISGSAVIRLVEAQSGGGAALQPALAAFVRRMKAATVRG